ncbi:helix-turn-helix transcriptional regulator [Clostridium sp. MSJ-11]|uniref:Helix-turn-helix transcriptional regulator n=1 Tax=Clostridium mobile TaxID=2841512 RepID=A0ABS6EN40_9CLOT|nr:helix-turn-helix transcriptional regulator [Clostridium mobile]MBU5486440.1 helix-turn-helix transcriptional regulator [Clostridium mobile]
MLKIKENRKFKEITQNEIAKKLNVSQSYISKIENDSTKCSVYMLEQIGDILEMCPRDLIGCKCHEEKKAL